MTAAEHNAQVQAERDRRREDLAWMVEGGENLTRAAHRLGIAPDSLAAWCREWAPDLGRILAAREPMVVKA